ncbi:unnamed protein product (macronuclear) [Paramecium tetraurelia]|uniref:Uncharacterized protein n=1 Tax=Paramecium tetraurelia TaxID=5888 RepID=A0C4S6_PARTE|nr:uncharacterized protein GSPATT00006292001 [Paramecium tetraurelia]CAK65793.1 unnamed protein product [Paramecium tetraurelia]|eukprot:XP_001433190.1 hypothetical protein (macronuclear) [Paramecium tetraurelia strain d4-2]
MKHQWNTKIQELKMQMHNLKQLLNQKKRIENWLSQILNDFIKDKILSNFLQIIDEVKNELTSKIEVCQKIQKTQSLESNKFDINDFKKRKKRLLRISFSKTNL